MKLSKILERLEYTCLQGTLDQEIEEVVADSRKAKEGSLFICIRGAVVDGHTFAKSVAGQGTKAIIVEEPVEVPEDVTVIQVKDSRYAMALVAAAYYDYPGDKLRVIGITGTKGKTTTTYMVKSILENAGYFQSVFLAYTVSFRIEIVILLKSLVIVNDFAVDIRNIGTYGVAEIPYFIFPRQRSVESAVFLYPFIHLGYIDTDNS